MWLLCPAAVWHPRNDDQAIETGKRRLIDECQDVGFVSSVRKKTPIWG